MKTFEISKRKYKNGRRKFTIILHEIYPDDVVDEIIEQGSQYNENGITWIREYCEKAMPTIKDMSVRVEFLDDERTEICGHGETGIVDGLPIFENASTIGHCTRGYIDTILDDDGVEHTVMCAEGFLDEMCYKSFVEKLESDIANGDAPFGSVEIYRAENNEGIGYKYGYKEKGRIPSEFIYSGYALLGVAPADNQAKIIELNELDKDGGCNMNESEVKSLIEKTITAMANHESEINECKDEMNKCKEECEQKVAEAQELVVAANTEKEEAVSNAEKVQAALDACKQELADAYAKLDALYEEKRVLEKTLGEVKAKERIGELNAAIDSFSDEERAYAQTEIDAFNADPIASEINTVVSKIYEGIGMKSKEESKAKAEAEKIAEINSKKEEVSVEDIFGEINSVSTDTDTNIF